MEDPELPVGTSVAAAGGAGAAERGQWAWAHLPNRPAVWGGSLPLCRRKPGGSTSVTKPSTARRGKVELTAAILVRHFIAGDVGDVCGLHTTSPENTSKWF